MFTFFNKKVKHNFPERVEQLWLCGAWLFNNKKDYETGRRLHMPYFYYHKYVKYSIGQEVLLFKDKDLQSFYEIIDIRKYAGSDPASFDDQREYTMKLVRVERKEQL